MFRDFFKLFAALIFWMISGFKGTIENYIDDSTIGVRQSLIGFIIFIIIFFGMISLIKLF